MIRPRILMTLLCVAVIAVWFAPESREVVIAAPHEAVDLSASAAATEPLTILPDLSRSPTSFERAADRLLGDPEARRSAARVPKVPVLPSDFDVLGKAELDGSWKAVVSFSGKTHIVGTGDRIDDRFVIEKIDPPTLIVIDLEQSKHSFTLSVGAVR